MNTPRISARASGKNIYGSFISDMNSRNRIGRLPTYESKRCNGNCNFIQSPEHLLLHCHHLKDERLKMINQMKPQTTTLKTLFGTKKGIENLAKFLIDTEIATRRWILGDSEENEQED
jgi:hypothetical protein